MAAENNAKVPVAQEKSLKKRVKSVAAPQNKIVRLIGEVDRPMLIIIIALVCIGSVMIFSASYSVGETKWDDSYYFARSQIRWVAIGIVLMSLVARFLDYRFLKRLSFIFYAIALGVNYLVPVFGETIKGATRWFNIMGVQFQPSELLKFALVLALSTYISDHYNNMRGFFKGVVPIAAISAPAALATFFQNHLSATIIMLLIAFSMMWLAGVKKSYFGGALGIAFAVGYYMLTEGIELIRTYVPQAITRLSIWEDPFAHLRPDANGVGGEGWQPAQSLFAISSGGFWGLGLGQSKQKHGYLPEPQNDYIFAILCEELGFFGVVCVLALFCAFAYRGYFISKNSPNRFCSLVSMGITAQVIIQVVLNLCVVTNTLPSTGISLPFFSYGGTSLVILLVEMGIILSISRYSYIDQG